MKNQFIKKNSTIGCCGIDCGLCPTYHSNSQSKCPGCCGPNFFQQHPSCSILTCCVKFRNLEVCSECEEYPCPKLKNWDKSDSFVSHLKSHDNLNFIKDNGLDAFFQEQNQRIEILKKLLSDYNEGRSRSFFCLATTLISVNDLREAIELSEKEINSKKIKVGDLQAKSKILKEILKRMANKKEIILKLRKK